MEKRPLEQRAYNFEIRAQEENNESRIIGRPIVYGSLTDLGLFDEVIAPGALKNADLTDVRFLVNHDTSKIPLARSRRNNGHSTMQLTEDEAGLAINVLLDTENNAEAKALYSAVQRGDITGMSFMFSVRNDIWEGLDTDHPTRRITDIGTVVEVSAVTFPAYEATSIYTRGKEALEKARAALEKAKAEQRENALEKAEEEQKAKALELLKEKIKLL